MVDRTLLPVEMVAHVLFRLGCSFMVVPRHS